MPDQTLPKTREELLSLHAEARHRRDAAGPLDFATRLDLHW